MTYIVAPNGIYSHRAATGNVVWDDTHTCPADKLKPEEAELFGVFPLVEVDPPPCGPDKTAVPEDPTLVDGQWLQQWAVRDATTDEMAQRALEARERFKAERAAAVRAITVTTAAGNTFDGGRKHLRRRRDQPGPHGARHRRLAGNRHPFRGLGAGRQQHRAGHSG